MSPLTLTCIHLMSPLTLTCSSFLSALALMSVAHHGHYLEGQVRRRSRS